MLKKLNFNSALHGKRQCLNEAVKKNSLAFWHTLDGFLTKNDTRTGFFGALVNEFEVGKFSCSLTA